MKIAVTSRSFSQNELLRAELLQLYPDCKFNDLGRSLADDELVQFLKDADAAIIALEKITANILSQLPNLKLISKYGVGIDNLDLVAMKQKKISLGWTSGVNALSVAELTLFFMLGTLRKSFYAIDEVRQMRWQQVQGNQLSGKKVGLIGFGNVGSAVAKMLKALDCEVSAYDILDKSALMKGSNVSLLSLDDLLKTSDIVSLHIPYEAKNHYFFNEHKFGLMKPGSILINTSRGGIVDEAALFKALEKKMIAGAAFDVLEVEPPKDWSFLNSANFIVTPHIGGSAKEAVLAMGRSAIRGLSEPISY